MEHLRFLVQNRLNAKTTAEDAPSEADLHTGADWKESLKPIGYLRSCFRRKVRKTCVFDLDSLATPLQHVVTQTTV